MRTGSRWASIFGRAVITVTVLALWVLLAPSTFGGQTSYVMVAGASMEPTLHQGDLVLARPAPDYQVGQVVTYDHPQVGPVIHRIIDRLGARYVLRGDANSWTDSYAPRADEIIGRSWAVLPRGGELLMTLRSPSGLAALSLLFGAVLVMTVGPSVAQKRKEDSARPSERRGNAGRPADGVLFALAVLAVGSLLLAIAAFSSPIAETVPAEAPYRQEGRFNYSAGAPATVYSGASLETGDPVFDALISSFTVAFDYQFASADPADVQGTLALLLEVSEPNGWSRTLPLQPETRFDGPKAHAEGIVDMVTVRRMLSLLEQATSLDRDSYQVDVIARVTLDGRLAGHDLAISFEPRLPFALDDYELYLRRGELTEDGDTDPTTTAEEGFLPYPAAEPGTLSILGLQIPVTTARAASVVGLLIALGLGAVILVPYLQMRQRGQASRVLAEYDGLLVSVRQAPAAPGERIEVHDFDDMVRLAERTGHSILHVDTTPDHDFYLQDGGRTYHVRLTDSEPAPPAESET